MRTFPKHRRARWAAVAAIAFAPDGKTLANLLDVSLWELESK
jgi:hypothetical protein